MIRKIGFTNKRHGDDFWTNDANEIKAVVNNNADELSTMTNEVTNIKNTINEGPSVAKVAQTSSNVTISPNVLNVWSMPLSSLTVALKAGNAGLEAEYKLEFTVTGNSFTLALPSSVRWLEEPEWEDGYIYQVSILDNLALYAGWEAATK